MKSKSTLMLIEISVMLFVFALAAAVCLKGFSLANSISKQSEILDDAVIIANNACAILKHTSGDIDSVIESYDEKEYDDSFSLKVTPLDSEYEYLSKAKIDVEYDGDVVFTVDTAWQKEAIYEK